jgi:hypothetical protein
MIEGFAAENEANVDAAAGWIGSLAEAECDRKKFFPGAKKRVTIQGFADRSEVATKDGSLGLQKKFVKNIQPISVGV